MRRSRLRIHFTAEDLGRVRLARSVDPMWEITLSLHLLCTREAPLAFNQWRRRVRDAVRRSGTAPLLSMLSVINPPASYFPDFLTPSGYQGDLDGGIEAIRSTPASAFREQLTLLARTCPLPSSVRPLATGRGDAVAHLCDALRVYHDIALGPFRRQIDHTIGQVRDRNDDCMTSGGSEMLLRCLEPLCRWRPPVLEAPFPNDVDLHLDGRGLLLVPSFFCVGMPVKYFDPDLPPTLVYPVVHDPRWPTSQPAHGGDSLASLIGETRTRLLEYLARRYAAPTHVLGNRLHISAPTVSYHTKVLRDASLITSRRDGPLVVHHLTPLGAALLDGAAAVIDHASGALGE